MRAERASARDEDMPCAGGVLQLLFLSLIFDYLFIDFLIRLPIRRPRRRHACRCHATLSLMESAAFTATLIFRR